MRFWLMGKGRKLIIRAALVSICSELVYICVGGGVYSRRAGVYLG